MAPAERAWRHSLLARLLAASTLVAICSVSATAWLVVRGTSGAIRQEQGQELADDARIYESLLGYAATHSSWTGVEQLVRDLGSQTGRHVTLTTVDRSPLAASTADEKSLPVKASAIVDPLAADVTVLPGTALDRIDPRATGPFTLPAAEREQQWSAASGVRDCLARAGTTAQVAELPSGRMRIIVQAASGGAVAFTACGVVVGAAEQRVTPTPTERQALGQLQGLFDQCLRSKDLGTNELALNDMGRVVVTDAKRAAEPVTQDCLTSARVAQLRPFVAPPALLFIDKAGEQPDTGLSAAGAVRIGATALVVLVLTIGISVLVATRLVRPVRELTTATRRMRAGDHAARVGAKPKGELGELAEAFNEMSEHVARTEDQRKAMISDVSHELRNPVTTMRSWLVAAQDGVADVDAELVDSLLEETLLLQHLVDDLQELALADAGRLTLQPEEVHAAEVLHQVAGVHQAGAGVRITVRVEGDVTLRADPVRLRQAIGNLVVNALRYTPSGGLVTLAARADGSEVVFEVQDTGSGIEPADLPHVFDRFWRADKSRNRESGGSGLGLAIVRHLVEAHGGTVAVRSTPGQGTTFTLRLPAGTTHHALPTGSS